MEDFWAIKKIRFRNQYRLCSHCVLPLKEATIFSPLKHDVQIINAYKT